MGNQTRTWGWPKAHLPVLSLLLLPSSFLGAATAPVVDSLSATPSTIAPGGTVTISVAAHDPDCTTGTCTSGCGEYVRADLTQWSADGGTITGTDNGVSSSPYAASATWQAPDVEGSYQIAIQLSDSGTWMCGGRLTTSASVPIQVSSVLNEPPVIHSLLVEPVPAFPGETVNLTCDASDPEGGALTYAWSADAGTLTPGAPGSATLVVAEPGTVTVTCTVTDDAGGAATASAAASISAARSERSLTGPFVTPQRVTVDSTGRAWVVDQGARGLVGVALDEARDEEVARISLPGARAVAADWDDRLLVGGAFGMVLLEPSGRVLRKFDPGEPLGGVTDVAIDADQRRYLALYRTAARVVVFDETGARLLAFGTPGDGEADLKSPSGLAVGPGGSIAVADAGHGRIQRFTRQGAFLYGFGRLGGGLGEFVQLDAVAYDGDGILYASDSFQSWVLSFYPDGRPREAIGGFGVGAGRFRTPAGLAVVNGAGTLVVASLNTSSLEVFRLEPAPGVPPPQAAFRPAELELPATEVATPSVPRTARLVNLGASAYPVGRIAMQGEFALVHDCPGVLAPGAECTLEVTAVPRSAGVHRGRIALAGGAGEAPRLALVGRGLDNAASDEGTSTTRDLPRLRVADTQLAEGDGEPRWAVFPVTLSSSSAREVTVDYATQAGSASAGEDFEPVAGRLTLAPGETRGEITVPVRGDRFLEDERETFTLRLSAPRGALLARATAVGTILDDERCPGPDLLDGPVAGEAGTAWSERGAWSAGRAPAASGGGPSRIAAGPAATERSRTVDLSPWAEWIGEGEQRFELAGRVRAEGGRAAGAEIEFLDVAGQVLDAWRWRSASGAGWQPVEVELVAPREAVAARVRLSAAATTDAAASVEFAGFVLRSLRRQALWLEAPAVREDDFGAHEATVVARLACADRRPVRASVATSGGTATPGADYLPFSASVAFAPGETRVALPLTVFGDEAVEGDEDVLLEISSDGMVPVAVPVPTARLRILDDDGREGSPSGGPR